MEFTCLNCSEKFLISDEDLKFYKKMSVPVPKSCSECRQQRRFAYRNEWGLHKRKCDKCGKELISMFSSKDLTVYCEKCWWADDFDPCKYGQEFDFNKPFFEQMSELLHKVPLPHLINGECENSDYTAYAWKLKNSYLVAASDYCEDCMYSTYLFRSKDCVDCLFVNDSELLYQCIDCKKCYGSSFLQNCQELNDCSFCFDCRSCHDCLGCVGLRQKHNCIFNKEYLKEEYEKEKLEFFSHNKNLENLREQFQKFKLKFPHKYAEIENCENCSGDHLMSSKNCNNSFDLVECEDLNYCELGLKAKDCMDCTGVTPSELCYETIASPENYFLKFSAAIWPKSSYLEYCIFVRASNNCFGCVSLHKNQYCILNKQYTKEEYEELVPKIIEHMGNTQQYGEFFPINIAPFNYNETLAQDYFPLSKEEILENDWKWFEEENPDFSGDSDNVFICEVTGKPYRIVAKEFNFYKKLKLPLPKRSPLQRHKDRMSLRNPRKLWNSKCSSCGRDIMTSYKNDGKEKIYCEECYLKGVY